MWRKGNPLTQLVGMQTGTATVENKVEILFKKNGNRTAILLSNPTSGHTPRKQELKGTHVPQYSLQQCLQ